MASDQQPQQKEPKRIKSIRVFDGKEWVTMDGLLAYLDPADREQVFAFVGAVQEGSSAPLESLFRRLSPAGGRAFFKYMELAVDGGLDAVMATYKRETGKQTLDGLRAWLETGRAKRHQEGQTAENPVIAPALQKIIDRAVQLSLEDQTRLAWQFHQALDAFLARPSPRPVYHSEEEFMRALGMDEEQIARVMAASVEPEPSEEYDHANI